MAHRRLKGETAADRGCSAAAAAEAKKSRLDTQFALPAVQRERVERWRRGYPPSIAGLTDSVGRPPRHSFFYPAEEYEPEHLDALAELCRQGLGEVEVHLHHDGDTSENLRATLIEFKEKLYHKHALLAKNATGEITYGFIHGNWALDKSRRDGRCCGVNDELTVRRETCAPPWRAGRRRLVATSCSSSSRANMTSDSCGASAASCMLRTRICATCQHWNSGVDSCSPFSAEATI